MNNPLTRKLELFGPLSVVEKSLLNKVVGASRDMASHTDVIREGDAPTHVHLVLEGLCCRYKFLKNGDRQILGYLVPGDLCDLNVFILKDMDHGIATLSGSRIVDISRDHILELLSHRKIARALWWTTLVDEATLREWLVNIGQRGAEERIAHLFCELHLRMQSVGLASNGRFEMSITQAELADTMGLSAVHANRSLQSLRARGLIEFKGKTVDIAEVSKLRHFAGFNPNYLHLNGGKEDRQS